MNVYKNLSVYEKTDGFSFQQSLVEIPYYNTFCPIPEGDNHEKAK